MSDDKEERRQQDLRDFEFYKRRVRPTASDLWRIIDDPGKNHMTGSERRCWDRDHDHGNNNSRSPTSLIDVHDRPRRDRGIVASAPKSDTVWSLVSAAIVLGLLGLSGKIDRLVSDFAF